MNVDHKDDNSAVDLEKDELIISENDASVALEGPYPEIYLSDRVEGMLDKNMEQTVVVKLLGWLIGYKALLNRIQSLWKPNSISK